MKVLLANEYDLNLDIVKTITGKECFLKRKKLSDMFSLLDSGNKIFILEQKDNLKQKSQVFKQHQNIHPLEIEYAFFLKALNLFINLNKKNKEQ